MTGFVRLHPDDVLAIVDGVTTALATVSRAGVQRWLSTSEVAAAFARSQEWVRDHAAELGGRKIGGPRAPWQFPATCLEGAASPPSRPGERPAPAPRRRVSRPAVTLLPIRS